MTKKKPTPKIKSPLQKAQKDTIHVDVDDDITSLINDVKKSSSNIVAIVLPKNARVLQSVVNMKLLKRSATRAKKNIALVTGDKAIHTLAGIAGVHVAETATSKPFIPEVQIDDVDTESNDSVVSMGGVATAAEIETAAVTETDDEKVAGGESDEDTADTDDAKDNKDTSSAASKTSKGTAALSAIKLKNKKFKVPDFGSFQTRLVLGIGGLILLIILWYIGFVVMPKATVTVTTNSQNVSISDNVELDFADTAELDTEERSLPAVRVSVEKSNETTQEATGEKNIGDKAEGVVTMSAQVCGSFSVPSRVPAGTGVSSGDETYITQDDVSFSPDSISGGCLNFSGGSTPIVAQEAGEGYNQADGTDFTVSGRSDVSATGSASGGTTEIVTVVSEDDVNKAKDSLGEGPRGEALRELQQELSEMGYESLDITLEVGDPVYSVSPKVGDEADSFKVSQTVDYELSGYKADDLRALVDAILSSTLSEENEAKNVSDNGFDAVVFEEAEGNNAYNLSSVATIGPSLDIDQLKEEFAGKKRGEIIDRLESIDGVQSAEVNYSPMWVTTTPKSANKITIEVQAQ